DLILNCLEKEPARRPQKADEVRERLLEIRSVLRDQRVPRAERPQTLTSADTEAPPHVGPRPSTPASRPRVPPPARPRPGHTERVKKVRTGIALTLAVIGAALLGGSFFVWRRSVKPAPQYVIAVTSDPAGGTVFLDGRVQTERTPARFTVDRPDVAVRVE